MSKIKELIESVKARKQRIDEIQAVIDMSPASLIRIRLMSKNACNYRDVDFNGDDTEIVAFLTKRLNENKELLYPLEQKLNAIEDLLP